MKYKYTLSIINFILLPLLMMLFFFDVITWQSAAVIGLAFQYIHGNILLPIIYARFSAMYFEQVSIQSIDLENVKIQSSDKETRFHSKTANLVTYFYLLLAILPLIILTIASLILDIPMIPNNFLITSLSIIVIPIIILIVRKTFGFTLVLGKDSLSGYFKKKVDVKSPLFKKQIVLENVSSVSLWRNDLLDLSKHIALVELHMNDGEILFLNLLPYNHRHRNYIIKNVLINKQKG